MECKRCNSSIEINGYCSNYKCPYYNWPQRIKFTDLISTSVKEVELKYGIKERPKFDKNNTATILNLNESKKISLMEEFIESYGLKSELMVFLQEEINRENSAK